MDIVVIILVLILILGLLAVVGYLYYREAGPQAPRLWVSTPVTLRETLKAWSANSLSTGAGETETETAPLPEGQPAATQAITAVPERYAIALDDTALRELREELQGELRRAAGLTREFDARLTRIETNVVDAPQVSARFEQALAARDVSHKDEIEKVHRQVEAFRRISGAFGERRSAALADLYGQLAKVEATLAGVVHPMLLPGEPLTLPTSFYPETMIWENWGDVGDAAYAFGNVFNQNRFVLDDETATELEHFMSTLREGLTGAVYPNVRAQNPSSTQIEEMRQGLQTIVEALPAIRRRLETVYRGDESQG